MREKMDSTAKIWQWGSIGIAAVMFLGMVIYSGYQEFWYDEVYQLGLSGSEKGIGDLLYEYAQLKDYTPPLYALISYVWMRLVPFSFRYFLLLSELMTAAGVWLVALAGEKIGGKKMGILAELFAATSTVLVQAAGYEFRSYGLYFMASALVLCRLLKRLGSTERGRFAGVSDTLALVLLLYSHYYGSVLFGVLFCIELFFVIRKRQKAKILVPYFVSGLSFLPWLVLVFVNRTRSMTEFWIQPPDLQSVITLFRYLCSDNECVLALFCFGIAGCIVTAVYRAAKRKRSSGYSSDQPLDQPLEAWNIYVPGLVIGTVGAMFLYGAVINPSGGIFYDRYFIGLLPCCFLLMAHGVIVIWNRLLVERTERGRVFAGICAALFLFVLFGNGNTFFDDIKKKPALSYTSSVGALSRKEDISSPETVVVTSDNSHVRAGVELYFEKLFHVTPHVISQHDENFLNEIGSYKKIYAFHGKQAWTEETEEIFSQLQKKSQDKKKRIYEYE